MRHRIRVGTALLALALPAVGSSQANSASPAPVLLVGRELVKPGKNIAHTKWETSWSRALEAAKYPQTLVALTSMSGTPETWFVFPYASLADLEKANATFDGNASLTGIDQKYAPAESEYLQGMRTMLLSYRPELSYSTGTPVSAMRFVTVTRILVRAGHMPEFIEARTAIKAAHEKAKLPDGYAIYQATSGMPAGTYFLLAGRKSLKELDDNTKIHEGAAYQAALGADWAKRNAALQQAYEASSDVNLYAMNAGMSIVPKEWKDSDPFWAPKAEAKKAP